MLNGIYYMNKCATMKINIQNIGRLIKESIMDEYQNNDINPNIQQASQLLNNRNNEVLWRCFKSEQENSIYSNGYSNQFNGDGEGSMYGNGIYAFYTPEGATERVGTGGVGNNIMKCALLNGFRDCLIFNDVLAKKYYGTTDISVQFKKFFKDNTVVNSILSSMNDIKTKNRSYNEMGWSAPIVRELFGKYGKYKAEMHKAGIRGLVYWGGNDKHACVIFNSRDVIPIATIKSTRLFSDTKESNDKYNLDNNIWNVRFSVELFDKIKKVGDPMIIINKLISLGKITGTYSDIAIHDHFIAKLSNGKKTLVNARTGFIVFKNGVDMIAQLDDDLWSEFSYKSLPDYEFALHCEQKPNGAYTYTVWAANEEGEPVCVGGPQEFENDVKEVVSQNNGQENINENITEDSESDFRNVSGWYKRPLASVYHRTNSIDNVNSIFKNGFSREFGSTECYGHGIYNALTSEASTYALKRYYGKFMIHSYLNNGFKNFVFCSEGSREIENLCYNTYPQLGHNASLESQVRLICGQKLSDEIINTIGIRSFNSNLIDYIQRAGITTPIRGIVYRYDGITAVLVCDYSGLIPFEYSINDGRTWEQMLTPDSFELMQKVKVDLPNIFNPLISKGIITKYSKLANGHSIVTLKNGKKSFYSIDKRDIISYKGFDKCFPFVNKERFLISEVIDNGETAIIVYDKNEQWPNNYKFYINNEENGIESDEEYTEIGTIEDYNNDN